MHVVLSPTMQLVSRISADKSQLCYLLQICEPGGIDDVKKGEEMPMSPDKRQEWPDGRNYISTLFWGVWLAMSSVQPSSSDARNTL